jgi:hypothetical protein
MNRKPILLWPKSRPDIKPDLGRAPEDFLIVDTNCVYDLQKLHKLRRQTPIFDPFPTIGRHYAQFSDHVIACDCHIRILGLERCRQVLRAQEEPSLSWSSVEELLLALNQPEAMPTKPRVVNEVVGGKAQRALRFPASQRTVSVDGPYPNWKNLILAAALVFAAALIGNALSPDNSLLAALAAALLFSVASVCATMIFSRAFLSWIRHARRDIGRLAAALLPFARLSAGRRTRAKAQPRLLPLARKLAHRR